MKRAFVYASFLVVLQTSCALFDNSPSIAGQYALTMVDAKSVPCCGAIDSVGTRVTAVSGTLMLGGADPEAFIATPAGFYPASCVHEVPNGSRVDTSTFPRCGDGDYTLTLTERFDYTDGSTQTKSTTSSGRYAWSDHDNRIKLVDASMLGSVERQSGGVLFQINHVNVMGTYGPTYTFSPSR